MKRWMILSAIWLGLAGLTLGQTETKVKVIGQRVNLRAKADPQAEVVGQLANGDILTAKSFQDEWVEILPPNSIDVWIHRDFIKDGIITGNKVYVRAGPGINFSVVGNLTRGDQVTPKGEFTEWVKIEPTQGCSLWINRSYIEVLQPEKPKPVVAAPVRAEPVKPIAPPPPHVIAASVTGAPAVQVVAPIVAPVAAATNAAPAVPPDMDLIPLPGQGRSVQREGVLKLAGFIIGRPSRYRLVRYEGNRIEPICYIRGNNEQLGEFLGQRLLIRGREYWVQGVRYPVVIPDQIVPRAQE